jgi:hypothetical protein
MAIIPVYENTDQEVQETATAAIDYIFGGESINEICDLKGLTVFGVIGALRENDERLYGPNSNLSPEEAARLKEVEAVVDSAVEDGMHYYPFGHFLLKTEIDSHTMARLSAIRNNSIVNHYGPGSPKDGRTKLLHTPE